MEKQRWTSEGVLSYLRPLSTYTMYMKYPNDEDNRKKLSRIPNQIRFIEEAINSNDLSKDDMKILHDFYRENQESIDKVYLYAGKKNELENFQKNILESLNISEFIDKKLESFENYFNSKNLETQRFSSNCIDAYIDKNRLSVRKKEDSYELEITNREEGVIKRTEISSIKDLDFEVNTFLDKLKRKETEKANEFNIDNIENFLNTKDLNTKRITPNCIDIYMDKVDLIIRKEKDDITLEIHDHEEKIQTGTKITSMENLDSIINIMETSIKERKANEFSIDNIEEFLKTKDFESKRLTPDCIDIYMDNATLTIRQEKDDITLEIYNHEKNSTTKTKVNDMENLESIINDVSNNSYRKETEEFLDKIEDFLNKNGFDVDKNKPSNEMFFTKKNLYCTIKNDNGELNLTIDKFSKPNFERLSDSKIESIKDVESIISKHITLEKDEIRDNKISVDRD